MLKRVQHDARENGYGTSVRKKKLKMGLSSNQARFLALTSRQVDLEHRIQQICQRRLRLTSELENVATSYNNKISNRKMFTPTNGGKQAMTVESLDAMGYKVLNADKNKILKSQQVTAPSGFTAINTQADFANLITTLNGGTGLTGKYMLNCDIDMSQIQSSYSNSVITQNFGGVFDGNGHTISNLNINSSAALTNVGFFSYSNGTIENLKLDNAKVNATNSTIVGALVGWNNGTIDNCSVNATVAGGNDKVGGITGQNSIMKNVSANVTVTGTGGRVGGLVGGLFGAGSIIENSTVSGSVVGNGSTGGIVGDAYNHPVVDSCYSSATVAGTVAGGIAGVNTSYAAIQNSYSTGNVSASSTGGGIVGATWSNAILTDNYTTSNVYGSGTLKGFDGSDTTGTFTDNFYYNNQNSTSGSAIDGHVSPLPTGPWDATVWNKSTTLPTLKKVGYTDFATNLEDGLRNGTYTLAKDADEYTQDVLDINNGKYQEVDWRSTPEIYDELDKGDDVDAENKYDKTVEEINAQDKKLQLEQTSIEVEYKAITSERESVKKILDTNAQSSFKYFS